MGDVVDDIDHAGALAHERLVQLAGEGNHDAFATLVEERLGAAFRTASAILGNEADARDVVQEAFVSAWVNLPRLRDVRRFDAWFSRILVNRCRDALRRRRRSQEIALYDVVLPAPSPAEGLDLTALAAAFERLPADQRNLLVMHHLHHEPVADIARQLGIPLGTAKWRLHAARRALETALELDR